MYRKRLRFLRPSGKRASEKVNPHGDPLLSPTASSSLKGTEGLENECSTTHRQAHVAICPVVSRGAKGLNGTPEFSLLQVEMPESQRGESIPSKVNRLKRKRSQSCLPVSTMPPVTSSTCINHAPWNSLPFVGGFRPY